MPDVPTQREKPVFSAKYQTWILKVFFLFYINVLVRRMRCSVQVIAGDDEWSSKYQYSRYQFRHVDGGKRRTMHTVVSTPYPGREEQRFPIKKHPQLSSRPSASAGHSRSFRLALHTGQSASYPPCSIVWMENAMAHTWDHQRPWGYYPSR